jgi:hypothetical protein
MVNPTARAMFPEDDQHADPATLERMEDGFFFFLRLANGTKKTTYRNRLDDVVAASNRLLQRHPGPVRLMDLAISSGVSTQEWMRALDAQRVEYEMHGTDLCLFGTISSPGRGFHVLRDSRGRALQYEICGRPLANHFGYNLLSRMKRVPVVTLARAAFGLADVLVPGRIERSRRRIVLVTRGLQASGRLRLYEADVFDLARLGRKFHMIRAANILNRAYFTDEQLAAICHQLHACLEPGGYLVVVRTRGDRTQNDGSVFTLRADGRLEIVERFGAGSEIESIVLAAPGPQAKAPASGRRGITARGT